MGHTCLVLLCSALAAAELAAHLGKTYPADRFEAASAEPGSGKAILIGSAARERGIAGPAGEESYASGSRGERGYVVGGSPRGVLHGVYALLEKIGWGFYLSYDAAPPPRTERFTFSGWNISDQPAFRDRVVFQWRSFLSSASTWELEDWECWIDGASRMRYNNELCGTGIRLQQPLTLALAAPMGDGFAPGRYTARIHATPSRGMNAELRGGKAVIRLDPTPAGEVFCGVELSMDGPAK